MDPDSFEQICKQVGLSAAMTFGRMSEERKHLTKLRSICTHCPKGATGHLGNNTATVWY